MPGGYCLKQYLPAGKQVLLIKVLAGCLYNLSLPEASKGIGRSRPGNRKETWRLLSEPGFVGFTDDLDA